MIRPLSAIAAVAAALSLSGCLTGNDGGGAPSVEINAANLAGDWVLTAATLSPPVSGPGGALISDFLTFLEDCSRDDILSLKAGGAYARSEGAIACVPPYEESGTWTLAGTSLVLRDDAGFEDTQTVVQATANSFTARAPFPFTPGHTVTFQYGRKAGSGGGAPVISQQPASVTAAPGGSAVFSVIASGAAPLAYQWRRNGSSIVGATQASYTLANVALSDNGSVFTVLISNAQGTVLSASATLTVTQGNGTLVGTWRITAATINPGFVHPFTGQLVTDIYALMEDCEKDNPLELRADGTYVTTEGPSKCDPTDPDIVETGTWSLSGNRLTVTPDGEAPETFTVTSITPTSFSYQVVIPAGDIDNQEHVVTVTTARL